jgi:glycosyltransferase involved in cell wall biosynthesis
MVMKVAHLLGGGIMCGAGEYALKLARGLSEQGFSFTLLTFKDGPLTRYARERGVPTVFLPKRFAGGLSLVLQLAWWLRKRGFHILHTHTANSHLYGRPAAWLSGCCKLVSTEHAFYTEVYRESRLLRFGYHLDLLMARGVDRHIAVSYAMRDRLVQAGLNANNILVIPNGIRLEDYPIGRYDSTEVRQELGFLSSDLLVGTTGRLTKVKNHELLIRAARRITQAGVPVQFLIVGDGPRISALRSCASRMNVSDRIHFLGWRNDLPRILSAIDIYVLSSYSEVAPFAILEAMAMQRPVIATSVGGVPEIVDDGRTGFLVPSDHEEAFAEAILCLAKDAGQREKMGQGGRERVATHFTESNMLARTADVYRSLMGSGRPTTAAVGACGAAEDGSAMA